MTFPAVVKPFHFQQFPSFLATVSWKFQGKAYSTVSLSLAEFLNEMKGKKLRADRHDPVSREFLRGFSKFKIFFAKTWK